MATDQIHVRGARQHNLAGVDVTLLHRRITVLTGVSGSGKSSLALHVLHAEARRRFLDALSQGERQRLGPLGRPDVDWITGLPPSIAIAGAPDGNRRSTVGTVMECADLLRVIFAAAGQVHCPTCEHPLTVHQPAAVVAALLALPDGTALTLLAPVSVATPDRLPLLLNELRLQGFARVRIDGEIVRLDELDTDQMRTSGVVVDVVVDRIRVAPGRSDRMNEAVETAFATGNGRLIAVEGRAGPIHIFATRPVCPEHGGDWPMPRAAHLSPNSPVGACSTCHGLGRTDAGEQCHDCGGDRISSLGRHIRFAGCTLPQILGLPVVALQSQTQRWQLPPALAPARDEIHSRCATMVALGLGHLPLARPVPETSSGERLRLRLAARSGGELSGVLYVLDEPSDHLGPDELPLVLRHIAMLKDAGNTLVIIDHHPSVVRAADWVIELGPGAGSRGGQVVFEGSPGALEQADTPTGRALRQIDAALPSPPSADPPGFAWRRADQSTLQIPAGRVTALVGPSGCGKSTLIDREIWPVAHAIAQGRPDPTGRLSGLLTRVLRLERAALGGGIRSVLATAAGIWDPLRQLLAATREARVHGWGAERFSFNRAGGRCERCAGTGVNRVELGPLPPIELPCDVCLGARFDGPTLSVRYQGLNAAQLLALPVDEAARRFSAHTTFGPTLRALVAVGLGYLDLGRRADSLSSGEAQRVRLARELARVGDGIGRPLQGALILLDAPGAGLHPQDARQVADVLQSLASRGAAVLCIAYSPTIIHAADHVQTWPLVPTPALG